MVHLNEESSLLISLCGGFIGYFLGGSDALLIAFMSVLVVDTLSGMIKSYIKGTYKSKLFRVGVIKKCGYMLAVILAVQLDKLIGDTGALRGALLLCFVANEGTSIIENLGEIGIKFPAPIINAIAVLRDKSEKEKDS